MASRTTLVSKVSEDLRAELTSGVHAPGGRLPAESQLAEHFSVSRPTIRAALRELEAMGLVKTQHGVGTFVVERPSVRAGLERLDSITDSIRATGSEPGMVYASRVARHVMPDEASIMGVPGETQVLELRRTITADGEVVAYSYDLIPLSVLPKGFDTSALSGSLFRFFREELGIDPHHGLAEVHAAHSEHVGWGPEAQAHRLFVMLNQLHYDIKDQLLMYSRTYFIEGRYNFTIYRSGL